MIKHIIVSLRPKQWIKNILIFAGLFFSKNIFNTKLLFESITAFFIFCILSSAIYLINDIRDIDLDKYHPIKRKRPLASGELKKNIAWIVSLILLIIGIILSYNVSFLFLAITIIFIVNNIIYQILLKKIVILDAMSIAIGFVLRVYAGTTAISVQTSHWLILCTFILSMFLAFGKRRHEITVLAEDSCLHRETLSKYSSYFIDQLISILLTSTLICYIMYTVSDVTVGKIGNYNLLWTVPIVLYGIFRYLFLIHRKEGGGDPSLILFEDKSLMVAVLVWIFVSGIILLT